VSTPRPLPHLDVYRSLHAGFQLTSPSAVIAAAAAVAAAAIKSSSSAIDHQEHCPQALPRPRPPETPSMESPTTVAATVTGGLMTSLSLPLLTPGHQYHPLLPTLGFTLEQVRVPTAAENSSQQATNSTERRGLCIGGHGFSAIVSKRISQSDLLGTNSG